MTPSTPEPASPLASRRDDRTKARHAIIYDGGCDFCVCVANWLSRQMDATVDVVPSTPENLERFDVSREAAERALQWISGNNRASGASAVAAWLRASPKRHWQWLGASMIAPSHRPALRLNIRARQRWRALAAELAHSLSEAAGACGRREVGPVLLDVGNQALLD